MKRFGILQSFLPGVLTCGGLLVVPQPALAQYFGNNFHGDFGVNSGTQAGPGVYVAIPFAQNGTPTYEADATDNVGLGMWGHEIQAGTTVYFDSAKRLSAVTTAFFEMHSNKKDQDLKVGNLLTLEGGAAYNVPRIGGALGVGYYLQAKLSDDSGADVPVSALQALTVYGKNRLFGIGPDVTMAVFQRGGTIGLVNARYLWESGGQSTFQGGTFLIGFTIARPMTN